MVTPPTVYDYHPAEDRLETLQGPARSRRATIPSHMRTERLMVPARDGRQHPGVDRLSRAASSATAAAGCSSTPTAPTASPSRRASTTNRFSLLDRGYAYAIAHIRGGDDLGYDWYLDGKLDGAPTPSTISSTPRSGLIAQDYTSAGNIAIQGGSAGGELMGAVVNSDPELWGAVVADVPFVDVLNTMLDDTLPLTPGEWPEWGNPITDTAAFELIRSYSPTTMSAPRPIRRC